MTLIVNKITTDTAFKDLQEEWNALLQQSQNNDITLTWEWLHTWWEVFKDKSRRLMILSVRDSNRRLVGIAPFQIREVRPYPFLPKINILEFLASGEDEVDEICTDYLNFIVRRGLEEKVIPCILEYLVNDLADDWDEVVLDCILGASENLKYLRAAAEALRLGYREIDKGPCYYITLPGSWDEFLNGLKTMKREFRYDLKKLSSLGNVTYKGVEKAEELEEGLRTFSELHQRRWVGKGEAGAFSSEKFLLFHKKYASLALKNGWLQLRFLLLDGVPLAALYNFRYNRKIYFYQSATDTQTHKTVSSGSLVLGYCIQECISNGMKEFDFLLGDTPYKKRWTEAFRDLKTIRISSEKTKIKGIRAVDMSIGYFKRFLSSVSSSRIPRVV